MTQEAQDYPTECENCDGYGKVWNNADQTSGQWVPCDVCEEATDA